MLRCFQKRSFKIIQDYRITIKYTNYYVEILTILDMRYIACKSSQYCNHIAIFVLR